MQAIVYAGSRPSGLEDEILGLQIGGNLRSGEADFSEHFGTLTSLERDLLVVASSIFACDLAAKRGMREEINRDITLTIPVVNFHAFEARRSQLERILHFLSDDNWTLVFQRAPGTPEPMQRWPNVGGRTLLFSGGLDSLAAAVDLLDDYGAAGVQLASHVTANSVTLRSQRRLHEYLEEHYGGEIERVVLRIGARNAEGAEFPTDDVEVSQRTRSFMFLAIAVLAARRRGMSEVVMIAENGQLAIHLPLSTARMGAFSTHTAHPEFLASVADFFTALLQYRITITNPYVYTTKAEMVAKLIRHHREAIPLSISCWKSARVHGHCGQCIPCYVRRISLEFHEVTVDTWQRDMFAENVGALPEEHEGKRNLSDLAKFAWEFRNLSDAELDIEHCELYNEYFDRDGAAEMFRRFAQEAYAVMRRYPFLGHLL